METVWALEKPKRIGKGTKPVRLRLGKKHMEYSIPGLTPAPYCLLLHTPDTLPLGKQMRYLTADIQITDSTNSFIHRDVYKLSSSDPTAVVEFVVSPGQAPAQVRLHFHCFAPFTLMVTGKLLRNYQTNTELTLAELGLQGSDMYKTLTMEDIKHQLSRSSDFRNKAMETGNIRPFLLLVSMHPATRQHVADAMRINIQGTKSEGDPHAEAWKLLKRRRKGILWKTEHTWESANPAQHSPSWHTALSRGYSELYPQDTKLDDVRGLIGAVPFAESLQWCQDSKNKEIPALEQRFLRSVAGTHHKEMEKIDKDEPSAQVMATVERLLKSSMMKDAFFIMSRNGLDHPDVHRFVVELCVFIHYHYNKENQKKEPLREKAFQTEEKDIKQEIDKTVVTEASPLYDLTDVTILNGLKQQLLAGQYDPRSISQKGMVMAKKAGTTVARTAVNKLVIAPLFPAVAPFLPFYAVVHYFFGSDHEKVFIAVMQLLLQRVLLTAHDISIESYY